MKQTPYWWEAAPRNLDRDDQRVDTTTDVVVIGGGYTGLSTALVLARAGVKVTLFEAGCLGEGASSRNGGMVGPSFHKLGIAGLKSVYGHEKTSEILKESLGFVDFLENFIGDEKIDADFQRVGRFRGALKPAHYDQMARQLEDLTRETGLKGHMVSAKDQATETGSQKFCGGLVYTQDGGLHPGKYYDGFLELVKKAGVAIHAYTPVEAVEKTSTGFAVTTDKGVITATNVAICTNGYTGKAFPEWRRRLLPIRSAMIATDEISPEMMDRLMPKKRMYGDSRRLVAYYRPSPDGKRILFGGRAASLKDRPEANKNLLRTCMEEIYPELKSVGTSHVWSGRVAYTFDHTPHIGQQNGFFYAMGYCGSGVARSTYFGQRLGYKILGDTEKGRTAFDDMPMPTKALYSGNPWFMPAVIMWHRFADRLGI